MFWCIVGVSCWTIDRGWSILTASGGWFVAFGQFFAVFCTLTLLAFGLMCLPAGYFTLWRSYGNYSGGPHGRHIAFGNVLLGAPDMIESENSSRRILSERVPPGGHWANQINTSQRLRIIDLEGGQGVDFLCYNAHHTEERYHAPNTLKASRDLKLSAGHVLYSDQARPIFTLVADAGIGHDTIGGCCSAQSNEMLYGVADCPGCRENFLSAMEPFGLDRRDIVPNINFFCDVPVTAERRMIDSVFSDCPSSAGDFVELRAEMDALAIISNCPQMNNPCNGLRPTAIQVEIWC